jgi:hypothetical protein
MSEPAPEAGSIKKPARQLECDNYDERFKARLNELVRHKQVEKPQ